MLLAMLYSLLPWRPLRIDCPNAKAMACLDSSRIVLHENIPGPQWRFQLRTISISGKTLCTEELDARARLLGADGAGRPSWGYSGGVWNTDSLSHTIGPPDDSELWVFGGWSIRSGSESLIVYRHSRPVRVVTAIEPDSLWAVEGGTGKLAILARGSNDYAVRILNTAGNDERLLTAKPPSGLRPVSSFPYLGMAWIGSAHLALVARVTDGSEASLVRGGDFCLLVISIATGVTSIIDKYRFDSQLGGNGLDYTRLTIGALGSGGVACLVNGRIMVYYGVTL